MAIIDRDRWLRLQPLLDHALDLAPEQCVSWLIGLSISDPDAASDLIMMLASDAEAAESGFLVDTVVARHYINSSSRSAR